MSRLDRAISAIIEAIATAADMPAERIAYDDDLIEDLGLKTLELLSLALILEEIFSISIPESIFESPIYRTAASLAEWCIRESERASWAESQRQRRRA